jgi:MFS family permease
VASLSALDQSLEVRDKTWALLSRLLLTGTLIGYLTHTSWRWCFGINLPIGVAAIILVVLIVRKELLGPQPIPELDETVETGRRTRFVFRLRTIDFWGQLLFLFGFGLVILALTWGGATYAWNSPAVLVSLIIGLIIIAAWAVWQRLMSPGHVLGKRWHWKRPMIQWKILADRNVGLLFYTSFATGMAQFAVRLKCSLGFFFFFKGKGGFDRLRRVLTFLCRSFIFVAYTLLLSKLVSPSKL